MRRIVLLASVLATGCMTRGDTATIRGQLAWAEYPTTITECGTGHVFELGPMASTPYYYFASRADELAEGSDDPILIEASGRISEASSSARLRGTSAVIYAPRILALEHGDCGGNAV